jgi:hypothetical protein
MSKKFIYGYDVNKYIDKAIEKMSFTYPWVSKKLFDKRYEYLIEKISNKYQFEYIYHWDDSSEKKILDVDSEGFIQRIIWDQEYAVEKVNEVKDVFVVPGQSGKVLHDWHLENYEFRSHKLGGYSVFCQAGDRVTGGSRTFFIPPSYFEGDYDSFLDKYIKLVPPSFGFTREELANIPELKKFLGY